jgi:Arm DNA-binding domain
MPDGSQGDFKARRYTIGTIKEFTLTQAEEETVKLLGDMARGRDPADERKQAKAAPKPKVCTVSEAVEYFIAEYHKGQGLDSWPELQRCLRKYVGGRMGSEPIGTVTGGQVADFFDRVMKEHGGPQANRVHSCTKQLFRWLYER